MVSFTLETRVLSVFYTAIHVFNIRHTIQYITEHETSVSVHMYVVASVSTFTQSKHSLTMPNLESLFLWKCYPAYIQGIVYYNVPLLT